MVQWVLHALVFLLWPPQAGAFIEEIFSQAFGGGGGGGASFTFQMGGDGNMFEIGGGGGGRRKQPKWPRGVPDKINKKFSWVKGTEWNWNNWRSVKFEKDGNFDAPTRDCQQGQCRWSAGKGKIYILWGEAGVHEMEIAGETPTSQELTKLQGLRMQGRRASDGDKCFATFQRVYDHEAAELDKDLYEILGLPDDAEESEIKKVYKKEALKNHPDKNPDPAAQQRYLQVTDAYEILSDPDKKILYDTGGMEAVKNAQKGQVNKGDDVGFSLSVTLEDLYNSGTIGAPYNRRVVCRGCRVRPDSPKCQGCSRCPDEVKMVNVQVGPGMIMQQQQQVASKEKCKNEDTVIDVHIEKGMRDGETITFGRMAEQRPGMLPGSVVFTLRTQRHKKFTRRGDDLHMTMQVSLREALLGWSQSIRHLDGHRVELRTDSVTKPYQVFRVKGEGMPLRDDPATHGDLYVKVEVIFPPSLTEQQREAITRIFEQTPVRPEL